jgi:hypothetical protein
MKQIIILTMLFCSACIKDYSSLTSSFIKNDTGHLILIEPYFNGLVDNNYTVELYPNEEKQLLKNVVVKGKSLGNAYGTYLQPFDSIIIHFDNTKFSIHTKFNSTDTLGSEVIKFNNNRSISNEKNWTKTITAEDKHTLNGFYTFTFTEQDYLDAK